MENMSKFLQKKIILLIMKKIAVCGDWLINSRVEGAFLIANELSKEIIFLI